MLYVSGRMGGLQVKNEVAELAYWAGVVGAGGALVFLPM